MPAHIEKIPAHPLLKELGIHSDEWRLPYDEIFNDLNYLNERHRRSKFNELIRAVAEDDFFFFCYFVLDLPINHPFMLARCNEMQNENGQPTLTLWAREHWKSGLRTFAKNLWDIIHNPDIRIIIFSHTIKASKVHLRALKFAMESNQMLKDIWPEIFFQKPERESQKWNEDDGLYVKRKTTAKEATISAGGLIDSMPTGGHWTKKIYDDLVDPNNVNTPDQVQKVKSAFQMSDNLGSGPDTVDDVIGTRYSMGDLYGDLIESGEYNVKIYPAEVDENGKPKRGGIPVYLPEKELTKKYKKQGEYIYSSQMLQNPVAESKQGFKSEWLVKKPNFPTPLNKYILVDPAGAKRKRSDYSVFAVIGTDALRNYWLVDLVRDRLNLKERWETLKSLVAKHKPQEVGYEQYGMQSDIEYFELQMYEEKLHFRIIPLSGNTISKEDRIKRLQPICEFQRFIMPEHLYYTNKAGETFDLIQVLVEDEYFKFPFGKHDDMLDAISRMLDAQMNVTFPAEIIYAKTETGYIPDPLNLKNGSFDIDCSWMGV